MKLKDRLFDPYSRRYWKLVKAVEFILPTGFTVESYEHMREHNVLATFLFCTPGLPEKFNKFKYELDEEIAGSHVDAIFEDAE
jgi:hypothetical protein